MNAQKPIIFLAFANEKASESRYLRGLAREQIQIREALEPALEAICLKASRMGEPLDCNAFLAVANSLAKGTVYFSKNN